MTLRPIWHIPNERPPRCYHQGNTVTLGNLNELVNYHLNELPSWPKKSTLGIPIDLAELTITPIPNTQPQKINIPILQPLARSPMFNACRNPDSRIIRMQDGRKGGVTEDEILNIKPLGLKWRQALRRLTLPSGPFVLIFDLTLPQRTDTIEHNSEERTSQTLYWDTGTPAEGGFGVPTHDLRILVVTLAIAVKMRAGSLCDFEVSARKEEGLMPKAYNDMISHLAKLSKYRRKSDGDALS